MPRSKSKNLPSVTDADYRHLAAFRRTLREFLHFSEQEALGAGMPPRQYQAMLAIRGSRTPPCLTIGELAERLMIRHHSAVGLVNRMLTHRLVEKIHDAADRRQVFVRLTTHGCRTLEKLSAAHKAELGRVGPVLRNILTQLKKSS